MAQLQQSYYSYKHNSYLIFNLSSLLAFRVLYFVFKCLVSCISMNVNDALSSNPFTLICPGLQTDSILILQQGVRPPFWTLTIPFVGFSHPRSLCSYESIILVAHCFIYTSNTLETSWWRDSFRRSKTQVSSSLDSQHEFKSCNFPELLAQQCCV